MSHDEIISMARDAGFVLARQRDRRGGQSVSQADRAGKEGRARGVREGVRPDRHVSKLAVGGGRLLESRCGVLRIRHPCTR